MQSEIRYQGEIIHLLTNDGFIQILIQNVNTETGQVQLGFVVPNQVSLIDSNSRSVFINARTLDSMAS